MKINTYTKAGFGLSALTALLASFATPMAAASGQTYIVSGIACHAITPNQAKFMEWRETGLVNQDTARDLFVVCPIMKFGDAEDFSVTIGLSNETNEDVDVSCTIREYIDGDRVARKTSPEITVPADSFSSEMVFSGGFQTDSHANVVCQLPNGIAIESVRSSTEVPPDNGGGSGEIVTPIEPISYSEDFESGNVVGWSIAMNAFDESCTNYLYYYGSVPEGQVVKVDVYEENSVLNVFSNYEDANLSASPDVEGICLEANVFREVELTSDNIGTYTFSYDIIEPPLSDAGNTQTGQRAVGYIEIREPPSYNEVSGLERQISVPGTRGEITYTIGEDMIGKLLRFGFATTAANYDPSGMYYDNVVFETPAQP